MSERPAFRAQSWSAPLAFRMLVEDAEQVFGHESWGTRFLPLRSDNTISDRVGSARPREAVAPQAGT